MFRSTNLWRFVLLFVLVIGIGLPFVQLEMTDTVDEQTLVADSWGCCSGEEVWISKLTWKGDELEVHWHHRVPWNGYYSFYYSSPTSPKPWCEYAATNGAELSQQDSLTVTHLPEFLSVECRSESFVVRVKPPREAASLRIWCFGPHLSTHPVYLPFRPFSSHLPIW
jgi:hypothetical protein